MFQKILDKICKKHGHKWVIKRYVIRKTASYPFVVEDFIGHRTHCSRCGETKRMVIGRWLEGYNSCEMPTEYWDEMRDKGWVIMRDYS